MRMLAEKKDEAFDLLKLAIQQPRFDAAPMDRIRAQIVSGIVANQRDPETAARVKWAEALYGAHPYARPDEGTEKSLATITADDLRDYHRRVFARDNLNVAVVGAIDAETVKRELDKLFGDLPEQSDLRPVEKVDLKLDQEVRVDYDLPQTSLQLAYPGVPRDAPDFFAAYLMNHILGGGTFTSRLFDEVREKRGLAYGINSSLVTQEYASSLVIGTATRSDRAAETLGVIRDTVAGWLRRGRPRPSWRRPSNMSSALRVNNLDSSSAIASTLLSLQEEKLGIDYIDRRTALIEAVTLDEVKAAARKLLTADPAILVIGPPLEGTRGDGRRRGRRRPELRHSLRRWRARGWPIFTSSKRSTNSAYGRSLWRGPRSARSWRRQSPPA